MSDQTNNDEKPSWTKAFDDCKKFLMKQLHALRVDYSQSLKEDPFDINSLGPANPMKNIQAKKSHSSQKVNIKTNEKTLFNTEEKNQINTFNKKIIEQSKESLQRVNVQQSVQTSQSKRIVKQDNVDEKKIPIPNKELKLKQNLDLNQKLKEKEAKLGSYFNKQGFEI